MVQLLWKRIWQFLKFNIYLPCDLAILGLDIYPRKAYIQTNTCTWIFIAAFSVITHNWKQPKCPSIGPWKQTVVYPLKEIVLSNKKKWTTDTYCKMADSQKHLCWVKGSRWKRKYALGFHLYRIPGNAN